MSNYLLSLLTLHVNFAARKSSLKNVSESDQPHCAEWLGIFEESVCPCGLKNIEINHLRIGIVANTPHFLQLNC